MNLTLVFIDFALRLETLIVNKYKEILDPLSDYASN